MEGKMLIESSTDRPEDQEFEKIIRNIQTTWKKISSENNPKLFPLYSDLLVNSDRCVNLIFLYQRLKIVTLFSDDPALEDILRSTVIFIHATLEEFLRRLAIQFSIEAGKEALEKIPLVGNTGRSEKFNLQDLLEFNEKSVTDVLIDSIRSYYDRSNFNNTTEITILLRQLGLPTQRFSVHFSQIEKLFERRHQIVHRLDKIGSPDANRRELSALNVIEISKWLETISYLFFDIIDEIKLVYE
jgi:hypothetical protein